jgi:hypothetical protein
MCNVAYHFKVNCIVNEFFKHFYAFQCYATLLTETLVMTKRNIWLITSHTSHHWIFWLTRKMMTFLEAITWIDFVPVWMYSLFDSSQNVSHIYKQLLCRKSRSTCSILFCIWILVKFFWYDCCDFIAKQITFHCTIALHNTLVILVTENTSYSKEDHLADHKSFISS